MCWQALGHGAPRQPRGFYRRGGEPQPVMVAPAILRTTDLSSQITPVIE
jgi:hypothetical protein